MSKTKLTNIEKRENLHGYMFIMPWLLGFFIFTLFPIIFSAYLSLCDWNIVTGTASIKFVGLDNYKKLFQDPRFYTSLKVTFTFCLISIPLYQITSLIIAMLLSMKIRFMKAFRLIYFMPSIIPVVATALIWQKIFNQDSGILNQALAVFGIEGPAWLSDTRTALYALIIMGVWGVGNTMIIYLSGLQGVDESIYEASEVDGANYWQRFFNITLPMITPTIFFNVVMAIIGSFQYFTAAFVMSQNSTSSAPGGPVDSTLFYNLYLYIKAFTDYEMGYSAAMAWVLFVIIMVFTLLILKSSSLWVYSQNDDEL